MQPFTPRMPAKTAGRYYRVPNGPLGTAVLGNGDMRMIPFYVWEPSTLDRIGAEVFTGAASSKLRLGVYADDGNFRPLISAAGLLLDAGVSGTASTVSGDGFIDGNTTGLQRVTVNLRLAEGWYWFACAAQGGAPTIYTVTTPLGRGFERIDFGTAMTTGNTSYGFYLGGVSGALPTTGTVGTSGACPAMHIRLS